MIGLVHGLELFNEDYFKNEWKKNLPEPALLKRGAGTVELYCLVELVLATRCYILLQVGRLTFFMWRFRVAVAWNGGTDDLKYHI